MPIPLALLLQAAPAAPAVLPRITTACAAADHAETIVVCGARRDRYRLPLPVELGDAAERPGPGEAARATSILRPPGACGLFAGQHACSKAEAARYGYGRGRDPVTVLGRLGRKLLDPDADGGEPIAVP